MAKILYILLCAVLLIGLLVSCGNPNQTDDENVPQEPQQENGDRDTNSLDEDKGEVEQIPSEDGNNAGGNGLFTPEDFMEELAGRYMVIDRPAVDFELQDLDGNSFTLSNLEGNIVFLNFWATWCPPCVDEMPHMQEIYDKYGDEGVVVLGINSTVNELRGGNDRERAETATRYFNEEHGFTFPILLDGDNQVWEDYMEIYPARFIPVNYVIDREGIIRYLIPGSYGSVNEMEAYIKTIGTME